MARQDRKPLRSTHGQNRIRQRSDKSEVQQMEQVELQAADEVVAQGVAESEPQAVVDLDTLGRNHYVPKIDISPSHLFQRNKEIGRVHSSSHFPTEEMDEPLDGDDDVSLDNLIETLRESPEDSVTDRPVRQLAARTLQEFTQGDVLQKQPRKAVCVMYATQWVDFDEVEYDEDQIYDLLVEFASGLSHPEIGEDSEPQESRPLSELGELLEQYMSLYPHVFSVPPEERNAQQTELARKYLKSFLNEYL